MRQEKTKRERLREGEKQTVMRSIDLEMKIFVTRWSWKLESLGYTQAACSLQRLDIPGIGWGWKHSATG